MLGLLVSQIVLLEDQRRTVRSQLAIAERQSRQALPLLEAARPLVSDVRAAQPQLRQAGGRLDRLTSSATPLVNDLRAARAGDASGAREDVRGGAAFARLAAVRGPALRVGDRRRIVARIALQAGGSRIDGL